jgi:flagellar motility protein MotE (MotC chaperone)
MSWPRLDGGEVEMIKPKWSRWGLPVSAILGVVVGLGLSAIAAPDSEATLDEDLRPSPELGRERVMVLLERQKRSLERREATLSTRESDLRAAEEQVEVRLTELKELREDIRGLLEELDEDRQARVTRLVKMLEAMRPAQAAKILQGTPQAVALEALMAMNQAKAGRALAAMDPVLAASLAEKLGAPPLGG